MPVAKTSGLGRELAELCCPHDTAARSEIKAVHRELRRAALESGFINWKSQCALLPSTIAYLQEVDELDVEMVHGADEPQYLISWEKHLKALLEKL